MLEKNHLRESVVVVFGERGRGRQETAVSYPPSAHADFAFCVHAVSHRG